MSPFLRWHDVTRSVRRASLRGLFGPNQQLRQLPDGSWTLSATAEEVEQVEVYARLEGNRLYMPQINVAGQPIELGGKPWTDEPEPFFDLTGVSGSLWRIMVGEIGVSEDAELEPPMQVSLLGALPASSSTMVRVPLALVRGPAVFSPVVRLQS
jgi:hypothetical protein